MNRQQSTFRLGRRPAIQGPRPLLRNQDRVGKSTTGTNETDKISKAVKLTTQTQPAAIQLRKKKKKKRKLRLGTWNVRSMLQLGKVQILGNELERLEVDLCGLCEVRWEGQGHFTTLEGHTIIYSGRTTQGRSGVAIWVHKKIFGSILGYEPINDRILTVRLKAKPRNITVIQAFGPTTSATEEELEKLYEDLSRAVKQIPKRHGICHG